MSDDKREHDIVCDDCENTPVLRETPFRETTDYVVACECEHREIDVSDVVSDSVLMEPITGKWSNFDVDSDANRNIRG